MYVVFGALTCMMSAGGGDKAATRDVTLHLKHGVEAKNYEDVSFHVNIFILRGL